MKIEWKTAAAYWYVHFSVEVICFYCLFLIFQNGAYAWISAFLYDMLAFVPQAIFGRLYEKHPGWQPGPAGAVLLVFGGALMILSRQFPGSISLLLSVGGFLFMTAGNCIEHITGAFETLKVSEGRLSEAAIFVGGGSFGVITGRLLSKHAELWWIPMLFMAAALAVTIFVRNGDNDFEGRPMKHDLASERPQHLIVLILGIVVIVRGYIGYGLPTAWNQTVVQTVFLFISMGTGKMLGGILSDLFGAQRIGVGSCLLAIPVLLVSDHLMWLSLIAVALFSMTMAVTLGGLVSVLKTHPGVAFGVTTLGLFLGTVPTFLWSMPSRLVCNILIVLMSVLSAAGLRYSIKA